MSKKTDGYAKAEQRKVFMRNRDLKLKDKELKYEDKISQDMCVGVCTKCREKAQWRFKYNKYKPLKHPATCADCKKKSVFKAYRTLCDACGKIRQTCPACCKPFDEREEDGAKEEKTVPVPVRKGNAREESSDDESDDDDDDDFDDFDDDDFNCPENLASRAIGTSTVFTTAISTAASSAATSSSSVPSKPVVMPSWDEKKFSNISTNKYDKARQTGTVEDRIHETDK